MITKTFDIFESDGRKTKQIARTQGAWRALHASEPRTAICAGFSGRATAQLTSSLRWRSDSPPIVFEGEIRHWLRIRFAFTRPYLGTARSMSKTLAVIT